MDTLKFAIGDEDKSSIAIIRNILQSNGHIIVCEENDGPSLLRKIRSIMPDFVIVGYNISGIKGPEIARIVQEEGIAPVLLIAENSKDIFVREIGDQNFAFLIKPVSPVQLLSTIGFVYNNFRRLTDLEMKVMELKTTLETRKLVEIAKGILIDNYNMKEKDAYAYIHKMSMDKCKPIVEIARKIIQKAKKNK